MPIMPFVPPKNEDDLPAVVEAGADAGRVGKFIVDSGVSDGNGTLFDRAIDELESDNSI